MMKIVCWLLFSLLSLIYSSTTQAQDETLINTPNKNWASSQPLTHRSRSLNDTLTEADWSIFHNYVSKQVFDSAYQLIGRKFISGKHTRVIGDWILDIKPLYDTYHASNHDYQFLASMQTAKQYADTISNIDLRLKIYQVLNEHALHTNDWKNAYVYQNLSDSLKNEIVKEQYYLGLKERDDSISVVNHQKAELVLESKKIIVEKKVSQLKLYIAIAVIALLLLLFFALLMMRRKKESVTQVNTTVSSAPQENFLNPLAQHLQFTKWISALMLQKGRTGEDLSYLKILEQSSQHTREHYFASALQTTLDEDRVIRKLKHIRIQIIGSNSAEMLLLKDSLKRMIRIAEIQTSEHLNSTTLSNESDVFVIIHPHPSLADKHQLPESIKSKLITIGFDKDNTISKPFDLNVLIDELMKHYEYKESASESIAFKAQPDNQHVSPYKAILDSISEARTANDKATLLQQLQLLRQATNGNEALHNWIDKLSNNYDEMNALQIDLALRNIVSYISKNSG